MFAKITSAICVGIKAYPIEIEVDISNALPQITIVGLPDQAVRESRDRIKSAIKNCGLEFPTRKKIVINLAPADIKKEGPIFDLPIALGILVAYGLVDRGAIDSFCIIGELALDGSLRQTTGALPIALGLQGSEKNLLLPAENAREAALQHAIDIYPAHTLEDVVQFFNGEKEIQKMKKIVFSDYARESVYPFDFNEVRGQYHAKRALEIAVSGAHNIMMIGPPGSGKTMLAKRLPSIFPELTYEEAIAITKIHSANGTRGGGNLFHFVRPFRTPHHTASPAALAGGGSFPKPGEVSLAHNGVLFLDELPEFNRGVLETLRMPMEDAVITVARTKQVITFPANFMLVCAMNPCPCGYLTDTKRECMCTLPKIQKYLSKISGPLLDRIDIHIEVERVDPHELKSSRESESSEVVRRRVNCVRQMQEKRFSAFPHIFFNARMGPKEIKKFCPLTQLAETLLDDAIKELALSARAYHKILKVARTIRDLKMSNDTNHDDAIPQNIHAPIEEEDIAEAIQYRTLDRKWWG